MTMLSWIAMVLGFVGLWLAGTKNYGWFVTSIGSFLWAIYAAFTGQLPLFLVSAAWWVTETRNYIIGRQRANQLD